MIAGFTSTPTGIALVVAVLSMVLCEIAFRNVE